MKKLIIVVLICFVIIPTIIPQTFIPIKFLDFKWGDSKEKVKKEMLKREGVTFYGMEEYDTQLIFEGGKFANLNVEGWTFGFYKNQLANVAVSFDEETYSQGAYLAEKLIIKYGVPYLEKGESRLKDTWIEYDNNNNPINTLVFANYYLELTSLLQLHTNDLYLLYINLPLKDKRLEYIESKKNEERKKGVDEL